MKPRIETLAFDAWLKAIFDHPRQGRPPAGERWYFSPNQAPSGGDQATTLRYLERLFCDARGLLAAYSDDEIADGLWYLLSPGHSGHVAEMTGGQGPLEARLSCLRSLEPLFRDFFAPRCPDALRRSTLEKGEPFPTLPGVLYMWWDEFPRHGEPKQPGFDEEVLRLLKRLLSIPHLGVQESALHGLGHWYDAYRAPVRCITHRFIQAGRRSGAPPALLSYADKAGSGAVQ